MPLLGPGHRGLGTGSGEGAAPGGAGGMVVVRGCGSSAKGKLLVSFSSPLP